MLTKFDDYPIHQTPEPIAMPASSDRNVYDRYWFNGYQDDGEFYFGIGSAIYPNLGIQDCGFSIVRGNEQHAFHASRRAPIEPTECEIGPFKLEVLDPMKRLRVVLDDNDTGISGELLFTARSSAVEEGRQRSHRGRRLQMDVTRFAQFGRWQGEIRYAGESVKIDQTRVFGTKDRSWGLRPVGPADPAGAPEAAVGQAFFLWAPIHWSDKVTHFGVFEDADAYMWHKDGAILPVYDDNVDDIPGTEDPAKLEMAALEHNITYIPGTRRASAAEITLVEKSGARHEISLEPLICFRMKGIGYMHPEWGHGHWKGEVAFAGESWKVDELEPMAFENQHLQQVVRARMNDQEGVGVLEQICFGPHARYGFKDVLDPA